MTACFVPETCQFCSTGLGTISWNHWCLCLGTCRTAPVVATPCSTAPSVCSRSEGRHEKKLTTSKYSKIKKRQALSAWVMVALPGLVVSWPWHGSTGLLHVRAGQPQKSACSLIYLPARQHGCLTTHLKMTFMLSILSLVFEMVKPFLPMAMDAPRTSILSAKVLYLWPRESNSQPSS
eukprot:829525-Amphidinium_carterae.1